MRAIEVADKDCKDDDYGQKGKYYNYEIKDAARTLAEAEKFKADKEFMEYVEKCVKDDLKNAKKAVSSIQDIRDIANKGDEEDDD